MPQCNVMKLIFVSIFLVTLIGVVSACSVSIRNEQLELRSNTDGYATSISAENSSPVTIRVRFDIDDLSGTDCARDILARSTIYRRTSTGDWQQLRVTSARSQSLIEDEYYFIWTNEFTVSDQYSRYRIDTRIYDSNNEEYRTLTGYVDVVSNNCSGIKLTTYDYTIDEGQESTRYFRIENNTNREFRINDLGVSFTNTLVRSGSVNYDSTISRYSQETVDVTLSAGYVSSNTTTSGTFTVSGYLDGTFCSTTAIGRKSFSVTVQDTGASSSGSSGGTYTSIADCEDLSIITKSIEINENSEQTEIFYLKNDSTKRFEITEVQLTNNGLTLQNYYNEKYASANGVANIVIKAKAENVFSNKTFENNIRVRGRFSDGRTCSFDNIQRKNFQVNIANIESTNTTFSTAPNCNNFSISVQENVQIENFGVIPFTVNNGTNQRADVYIEGTIETIPTLISLPPNSSVSRELSIKTFLGSGEITLRPVVNGCNFASKKVRITNTAKGSITSLTLNTKFEGNDNQGSVIIEVSNPTTRIFNGIIKVNTPTGWSANTREVTITPGTNTIIIPLTKTANTAGGMGSVSLIVEGEEITSNFSVTGESGALAGLFSLGLLGISNLGILLLIILVVILVVGVIVNIADSKPRKQEEWEEKD